MARPFRLDLVAWKMQIVAIVAMLGMIVLLFLPCIWVGWMFRERTFQIPDQQARKAIAYLLMRTSIRGPMPDHSPQNEILQKQFAETIVNIRGCSHGSYVGDGPSW